MVGLRLLWAAYGPSDGGVLPPCGAAILQGLQGRAELNGVSVKVLRWDGDSRRFIVKLDDCRDEIIRVKASSLRATGYGPDVPWANCEGDLGGRLTVDLLITVSLRLGARSAAALSGTSRALRAGLWLRPEARPLWEALLSRSYGKEAVEVARRARSDAVGPALFRCARSLRQIFHFSLEVVRGGVHERATGMQVVACPVLRHLQNVGIGAQGAVRRAAGPALEAAVAKLELPVPERSVTLVPGGDLAEFVALTVTEPPFELTTMMGGGPTEITRAVLDFLERLHANLFSVVRANGLRSVAMPTLCTGGMGMHATLVAIAAVRAARKDFCAHPADPLSLRFACYEADHVPSFNTIKDVVLQHFYAPEVADESLETCLFSYEAEAEAAAASPDT